MYDKGTSLYSRCHAPGRVLQVDPEEGSSGLGKVLLVAGHGVGAEHPQTAASSIVVRLYDLHIKYSSTDT